jgi:hypothetical protein
MFIRRVRLKANPMKAGESRRNSHKGVPSPFRGDQGGILRSIFSHESSHDLRAHEVAEGFADLLEVGPSIAIIPTARHGSHPMHVPVPRMMAVGGCGCAPPALAIASTFLSDSSVTRAVEHGPASAPLRLPASPKTLEDPWKNLIRHMRSAAWITQRGFLLQHAGVDRVREFMTEDLHQKIRVDLI